MRRSIAVSAPLAVALLFGELTTSNRGYGKDETAYATDLTPTPTVTPLRFVRQVSRTPTPFAAPGEIAPPPAGRRPPVSALEGFNPGASTASASAMQQLSDQIGVVSQQVAQAVQDPSLSIEDKVQQINSLAAQFNQLVIQWQQQLAQTTTPASAAPPSSVAGVQATPPATSPLNAIPGLTATPSTTRSSPTGVASAEQLRAQIAAVTQQMAQVSQDPSLSAEVKTAQLRALGTQFNQLIDQLQQLGG